MLRWDRAGLANLTHSEGGYKSRICRVSSVLACSVLMLQEKSPGRRKPRVSVVLGPVPIFLTPGFSMDWLDEESPYSKENKVQQGFARVSVGSYYD